jgi:peptidoglycan/xylan/chitin deacetylase (PgdA/CDA1 family)
MIPRLLKEVAFRVLQADLSVGIKLRAIAANGSLPILSLHRVSDRDEGGYAPMAPALFDDLVSWLKQRFSLIVFHDLATLAPNAKPPLILSFDDGYKDFIEYAVPILEKHRVCVNHNVIPAVIESGRPPMNVTMQDFVAQAPAALLRETSLPGHPGGGDPDNRARSCLRASAALKNRPIAEQKAIFAELERSFSRFDSFRETPVMSLDDIRQIAAVHEIGAHSFEHASMAVETDDYLREDTRRVRDYFASQLGFLPNVYAFPNGSVRAGQAEVVQASGFEHALLVGETYSQRSAWLHPRFTMHATTTAEARARALGWFKRAGNVDAG